MINRWRRGDWYGICHVCGKRYLSSDLKQRWDGLIVCPDDFELRHDLDFIRMPRESKPVPFIRKPNDSNFVSVSYVDTGTDACTGTGKLALSGFGTAGCMTMGNNGHEII